MTGNPFWPTLETREERLKAVTNGSRAAYVVAAVSAAIALGSLVVGRPVAGLSTWAFIDAVLAGVIGWRISRFSLPWAIAGVAYWVLNIVTKIVNGVGGGSVGGGVLSILFLLLFIGAVRGIFALRKFSTAQRVTTV